MNLFDWGRSWVAGVSFGMVSPTGPNIDLLSRLLAEKIGCVEIKLDVPVKADGEWWIDIEAMNGRLTIVWTRDKGYGFFLEDGSGFGDRPHKFVASAELAAQLAARVFERHATGDATDSAWDDQSAD